MRTSDGKLFTESKALMSHSNYIRDHLEGGEIELTEISSATLTLVITFLKHLQESHPCPFIEKPLRSSEMRDLTTEWYASFIDKDDYIVQELILAADFLEIKELLMLGCAKMGCVIRGLTIQEFRQRFNIANDFTPEEEAEAFDKVRLAALAEE